MTIQNDNINEIRTQFIDRISDNMSTFGVSATVGRILGIIYMNDGPMTLDELSAETGMSKTRMSQVVREMLAMDLLVRVFKKGVRKDLYQLEKDHYETFITLFNSSWQKAIMRNRSFEPRLKSKLNQMREDPELPTEEKEKVDNLLEELQEWMDYHDWIRRVAEFFESGEVFNHVPIKRTNETKHEDALPQDD